MDDSKIKVTDRRLFTEEGELRADLESYEDSAQEPSATRTGPAVAAPDPRSDPAAPTRPEPPPAPGPGETEASGSPQFLDLVDLLCQQVALALGDPRLGAGAPPPDLQLARLYIDLLAVLQEKTRGNLTDEEAAVLEELVYRFRMLYVEKQQR
ncbi:MAG TPA: DUF1844 domain-containing protein [Thermoanaerobaculia bacterium]|nr:DUF1844 domain-containing protein [Thermoanaerobaculia bacterium]